MGNKSNVVLNFGGFAQYALAQALATIDYANTHYAGQVWAARHARNKVAWQAKRAQASTAKRQQQVAAQANIASAAMAALFSK